METLFNIPAQGLVDQGDKSTDVVFLNQGASPFQFTQGGFMGQNSPLFAGELRGVPCLHLDIVELIFRQGWVPDIILRSCRVTLDRLLCRIGKRRGDLVCERIAGRQQKQEEQRDEKIVRA